MFSQLRRTKSFPSYLQKLNVFSPLFRYLPDPYPQHTGTHTRTHRRAYTGVGTLTYLGVGISATQRRASLTGRPAPQVVSGCPPLTLWSIPLSPHHIQGCSHPLQVESAGSFLSQERGKWVRAGTLCKWYLLMRRGTSQKWSWMVDFVLFGWFLVELRWHWF